MKTILQKRPQCRRSQLPTRTLYDVLQTGTRPADGRRNMWHDIIISCSSNDLVRFNNETQGWGNWECIIFYGMRCAQRKGTNQMPAAKIWRTSSVKNAEGEPWITIKVSRPPRQSALGRFLSLEFILFCNILKSKFLGSLQKIWSVVVNRGLCCFALKLHHLNI